MHIIQYLLQFINLAVWLLAIPYLVGLIPARFMPQAHRGPGATLLAGYIIYLALFELLAVVMVLTVVQGGFYRLLTYFTPLAIALAALGLTLSIIRPMGGGAAFVKFNKGGKTAFAKFGKSWKFPAFAKFGKGGRSASDEFIRSWKTYLIWLIFFILLAIQLFMSVYYASFDGDDAFYVAHSVAAWQRGSLFRLEPYTGDSSLLNFRSALAAFPIWIAMLSEKSRIHPAIMSHSVLPLFLLPLCYLLYYKTGQALCQVRKNVDTAALPMFMTLLTLIQMFGNVSIYANETFFLTRTWQGKAFAASFILPALLWLFLMIGTQLAPSKAKAGAMDDKGAGADDRIYWWLLAVLGFCAAIASALATFLAIMAICVYGLYLAIGQKNYKILLYSVLACIPGAAFMLLYYVLTR